MPFQPAPFTAQVTMVFALPNGAAGVNVYHVRKNDPTWSVPELEILCVLFTNWWTTETRSAISNECLLTRVEARDLANETAPYFVYDLVTPIPGLVSSPMLPANVSIVVTHTTGLTGRSARGRTYITGLPESLVSGNFVTPGLAGDLNGAFAVLLEDLASASQALVVLSRFAGGVARPVAVTFDVIASLLRDNRIDTQRRRLPRTYGN